MTRKRNLILIAILPAGLFLGVAAAKKTYLLDNIGSDQDRIDDYINSQKYVINY